SDTKWYIVLPQEPDDLHPEDTLELVLSGTAAPECSGVWIHTEAAAVTSAAVAIHTIVTVI
ncbi:hypothetical protein, partial [Streptomyces alanosinicus]|uniref:hypothetical protein n=1 Tax=Streptomyces alanosinicus TaxID=68171 RepID=UPI001E5B7104